MQSKNNALPKPLNSNKIKMETLEQEIEIKILPELQNFIPPLAPAELDILKNLFLPKV